MTEIKQPEEIMVEGHRCLVQSDSVTMFLDELEPELGWSPAVGLGNVQGDLLAKAVKRAAHPRSLASLRQSCLFARVSRGPEWEQDNISKPYASAVAVLAKLNPNATGRAMVKARRAGVSLDILEPLARKHIDESC